MDKETIKGYAKSAGKTLWQFAKDNGRGLLVNAIAQSLDVPVAYTYKKPMSAQLQSFAAYPRSAAEAAIDSLLASGKDMWADSQKLNAAADIYSTAKNHDDGTRRYAIQALTSLSNTIWSDAYKQKVNNYIRALAAAPEDKKEDKK